MKHILLSLSIASLFISCNSYTCDDLILKEGLYYEKLSGHLANGDEECIEIRNSLGPSNHVTSYSYKNGLPTGKWSYYAQGQLIQSGEYLNNHKLEKEIKNLTKAKTIHIETWFEGNYGELNIDIYSPATPIDTVSANKLILKYTKQICANYKLSSTTFRQKIKGNWQYLSFSPN
jgi:hypothetical protein